MRTLIFVIVFLLIIPIKIFGTELTYVFVVNENSTPLLGYRLLETQRDDIYITKLDPIKNWIAILRSQMIVVKDGYFYPVKDTVIIDKRKGIALLLIDFSQRKSLFFNPEEISIDRDIKSLIENKRWILLKVKEMFPTEVKKIEIKKEKTLLTDSFALAEQYEKSAQWSRALSIYQELLKNDPKNYKIIKKLGVVYYHLNDFKRAKEYFELLPKNEEGTIIKLAGIYIIEKNFEAALRVIDNSGFSSPYLHYLRGILFYLTDKKEQAYKEVSILLNMDIKLAQNLRDLLR
ncbi:MAG: tetratricopeptide repeat protein [Thermodesulfovibrio sp.]|nr:tetratricopeptide repeat protein [Thermodesulfovibrio sp.]MDW7999222.1 tetratricopeptide repeat protein [Thermodesulfovibrio sp.]